MGQTLDLPEVCALGNEVLELSTRPEHEIVANMASQTLMYTAVSKVPQPLRKNYDYGELWPKVLDDYRSGKIRTIVDFIRKKRGVERKKKKRKSANYVAPIDSYCGSKSNVEYWTKLLDGKPEPAVVDFIKYIREVACGNGEGK
jgi:hypothetical protein